MKEHARYLLKAVSTAGTLSAGTLAPLMAQANEPHVGGVIVAVSDIETASSSYERLGFTIKPGKLHDNGLLNAHIKLPNKTNIELMSLLGEPGDDIAGKYSSFLEQGEGGAYLELTGSDPDSFSDDLKGIEHDIIRGKYWDYVTFPEGTGLEHIFLFHPHKDYQSKPHFYQHENNARMIEGVWIEGGHKVEELLQALDFRYCGELENSFGATGNSYRTSMGDIIVTKDVTENRPRILGISMNLDTAAKEIFDQGEAHGIWIDNVDQKLNCE